MPDWTTLIKPELLILIPFLFACGVMIKNIPKIPDWIIPLALWIVGMVFAVLYLCIFNHFSAMTIPMGIVQGTFLAMTTVGANQLIKQITVNRPADKASKNSQKELTAENKTLEEELPKNEKLQEEKEEQSFNDMNEKNDEI